MASRAQPRSSATPSSALGAAQVSLPQQPAVESLALKKVIELQGLIIQLESQLTEARLAAQSHPSSVKGDVYRLICPTCIETIDLPTSHVVEQSIIMEERVGHFCGSHRYDTGYKQTSTKCSRCTESITFAGSIADCLKNHQIHKLFKR